MNYIVKKEDGNRRIDKFVRKMLYDAPLSFIYKMFRQKDVKVNSKKVDINYIIKEGDIIDIYITDKYLSEFKKAKDIKLTNINLNVIYEDENIIIVNKDKNILVHNGDNKEKEYTLQDQVINYLYLKNEYNPNNMTSFTPTPAHRIDRNTSGIVLFGKNEKTILELRELFENKELIEKKYLALVKGVTLPNGKIENYLYKDEKNKLVSVVTKDKGKLAITKYIRKEIINNMYSLVEANLLTGRTHQIRVHFSSINHPLIGDSKYGDFKLNKLFKSKYGLDSQFLHAYYFKFKNIKGYLSYLSNKEFISPLPNKLYNIIERLKGKK